MRLATTVTACACLLLCLAVGMVTAQSSGERRFNAPGGRKVYIYVPGQFTQAQAKQVAASRGGYPVVFTSMAEHKMVVDYFGFRNIAPAWTGHYQLASGREPGGGWVTVTGEKSAPLSKLFNSNGPDDGVNYKWGWQSTDDGFEIFYGPSTGKNEDGAVIWHDNNGLLEDVSVNHKGGVVVEINR